MSNLTRNCVNFSRIIRITGVRIFRTTSMHHSIPVHDKKHKVVEKIIPIIPEEDLPLNHSPYEKPPPKFIVRDEGLEHDYKNPKVLTQVVSLLPPKGATLDHLKNVKFVGDPKPLKLVNAVDPTVLTEMYKIKPSLNTIYLSLSKSRLTSFVALTAVAGYALAPAPLLPLPPDLIWVAMGTFMTSSSANTFNQVIERNFDGLMDRTKNRVLVKKLITPQHAVLFGIFSGSIGIMCLYSVNELAAVIGLCNLALYTCAYTPLKRKHMVNTWVGSIVGALPPLIGYAGACGFIDAKAIILSAIMFCWQFPHFNALSWNLRKEYNKAGYQMMCSVDERLCRLTTLRYSLILSAVCASSPLIGVTHWSFLIDSAALNAYLCYLSWKFYQKPDAKTSRNLFHYTLIHLPLLILFLIMGKKMNDCPVITKTKQLESDVVPLVNS